MPRYIDADKIVYTECCEYDGFDLEGYPLYKRTTKADKTEIDDLPTEDVVPKFEVDKALQLGIDIGEQEAAERIFEEIKVMSIDFTKKSQQFEFGYRFAIQEILAELKKKYIGE